MIVSCENFYGCLCYSFFLLFWVFSLFESCVQFSLDGFKNKLEIRWDMRILNLGISNTYSKFVEYVWITNKSKDLKSRKFTFLISRAEIISNNFKVVVNSQITLIPHPYQLCLQHFTLLSLSLSLSLLYSLFSLLSSSISPLSPSLLSLSPKFILIEIYVIKIFSKKTNASKWRIWNP